MPEKEVSIIAASEMHRLFIAVPLPAVLQNKAAEAMDRLRQVQSYKKWVHPEDLHLTLTFIGDVPPASIPAIETELEKIAARSNPFPLRLHGAGTFGLPHSPRVLWAGLDGGMEQLRRLQADVEGQMAALGYPPEKRPYSPHITLARQYAGDAPALEEAPAALFRPDDADGSALAWIADRIVLYRSHLGRTPMYEPVRTVVFHAGG